ncbi:MAG: hypothetical protein AAF657_18005 [Acidobacteriota bacterium]
MADDTEASSNAARDDLESAIEDSSDALETLAQDEFDLGSEAIAEMEEAGSELERASDELDKGDVALSQIMTEVRSVNETLLEITQAGELPQEHRQTVEEKIQQSQDALDQAEQTLESDDSESE